MPLPRLLKAATGTCRYRGNKAGIISRDHPDCLRAHQAGWQKMLELAADAAQSHTLDEKTLRLSLAEIARRSYGDGTPPSTKPSKRAETRRGPRHGRRDNDPSRGIPPQGVQGQDRPRCHGR